jgi:hypothetical protein
VARWLKQAQQSPAHIRLDSKNDLQPYSVHPVLRHVLPMDLKDKNLPRYLELQRRALAMYDRRLRQMDKERIRLLTPLQPRCTYTLEAMYHIVQLQLHGASSAMHPQLVQQAQEYWDLARACYEAEPPNSGRNPFALQTKWDNDMDLHEAIAQFPDAALLRLKLDKILQSPFE